MTDKIREKLWNIDLVIDEIKEFPQTYKTILQDQSDDGTCQFMLRRKLNKICKDGIICKTSIPGTRFGKSIFYTLPKTYHILIMSGRIGSDVYCFFKYKKLSKYYIEVQQCWKLEKGIWKKKGTQKFFEGNVLKWI